MLACRCCGSTAVRSRGQKSGQLIRRSYEYFSCADCDYLFVEPFAGYQIYDQAYYEGRGPDPFVNYEREYQDYRQTDRILEFDDIARLARHHLAAKSPSSAPVDWLDFGTGAGGLLKYLSDLGSLPCGEQSRPLHVTGHDVGAYADKLKNSDGFTILDIAGLNALPSGSFDIITLIEVIEHVEYPAAVIALVARLLRPGGLLILTTGNNASPIARRQGLAHRYYLPEIHVGIFNPRSLGYLYSQHGLTPRPVRYAGVIKFKVLKSLLQPGRRALARLALRLPPFVRLIDYAYGVSAMPCAVKPGP